MKPWSKTLIVFCCAFFSGQAAFAETFRCSFKRVEGIASLMPTQVRITTRPDSGAIEIEDTLSSSIGQALLKGKEDIKRPKARRFTWALREIPRSLIPAAQNTAARDIVLFSVMIQDGSLKARLTSQLVIGSASASEGVHNMARGQCKTG